MCLIRGAIITAVLAVALSSSDAITIGEDGICEIGGEPEPWEINCVEDLPMFARTQCGRVEGRKKNGVYAFKGIPYAKPPVNELRWKRPVSLAESGSCWGGTFKALEFGPFCAQNHPSWGVIGEEDCLHLNVYTPSLDPSRDLPVVVWIHGGYLMFSGSSEVGYHPNETTVADTGMVYVTFNYRLNGFGFLALDILSEQSDTLTSGNYGFMDQILALEWVRDNIKNFGGNPKLVTVIGNSSGGTSVMALSVSPLAKGLFHRAWMSSASPLFEITLAEAARANVVFLERSNCSDLECIYSLTPEQIIQANPTDVYPYWGSPNTAGLPLKDFKDGALCVIDGVVVPLDPLTAWKEGKANDVPLVIGTTAQEIDWLPHTLDLPDWTWNQYEDYVHERLDPFGANITEQALSLYSYDEHIDNPELVLTTMISDAIINCGAALVAEQAAQSLKSPVYRYVATWWPSEPFSTFGMPWKPRYAFHTSEMLAFFGFLPHFVSNPTQDDRDFQRLVQGAITHFAREGVMPPEFNWPEEPTGMVEIGSEVAARQGYHENQCKLWMENGFYAYSWIN